MWVSKRTESAFEITDLWYSAPMWFGGIILVFVFLVLLGFTSYATYIELAADGKINLVGFGFALVWLFLVALGLFLGLLGPIYRCRIEKDGSRLKITRHSILKKKSSSHPIKQATRVILEPFASGFIGLDRLSIQKLTILFSNGRTDIKAELMLGEIFGVMETGKALAGFLDLPFENAVKDIRWL